MNTQSKHTPGPWVVRHDDMVCSKEGRIIADCESTSYNMRPAPPIAEDKANAALIAAAPAMHRELETVREYLLKLYDQGNSEAGQYAASIDTTLAQAKGGE